MSTELLLTSDEAITFTLKNEKKNTAETYGVELSHIEEVRAVENITRIPNTPNYVSGLMNLHGMIISVIDVKQKLGFATKSTITDDSSVIVSIVDDVPIGFLVDDIDEVVRIKSDEVQSKTSTSKYVEKVVQTEKGLLRIFNLQRLITDNSVQDSSKNLQEFSETGEN